MPDPDVALVVAAAEPHVRWACAEVFPGVPWGSLTRDELRPRAPFAGPLFEVLSGLPHGACVGLVVPVRWTGGSRPAAGGASACDCLAVSDHVNLELRGPLTGCWPAGVPRDFPQMAGIYQPALVRACGGPRVYSSGVVVAGVADAARLSPFEARAVAEQGVIAVSDTLVPAAVVAAYYGLTLAACGVPPADDNDEQ
jgi:hypothetical protein